MWQQVWNLLRHGKLQTCRHRDEFSSEQATMSEVSLITLDPGHFHAALVQKAMYPGVAPRVHVYAPLGADLIAHLNRIAGFNTRKEKPTAWELEIHAGPESRERMLR